MAKDAFISHAAEDAAVAAAIIEHIEDDGLACWIAPRDVRPGCEYASEIIDGIESCAVFVLMLSAAANLSPFVKREVERAASKGKPILTFRVAPVEPDKALELFVSSAHWIDAWEAPLAPHLAQLADAVRNAMAGEKRAAPAPGDGAGPPSRTTIPTSRRPGLAIGIALLALAAGLVLFLARDPEQPAPLNQASGAADAAAADPCPLRLSVNRDLPTPFTCTCGAGSMRQGTVWGTNDYTDDSGLCQAALHAGVIAPGGGKVTVMRGPGHPLYVGSSRNDVESHDYGDYERSIRFVGTVAAPPGPEPCPLRLSVNRALPTPFTCICGPESMRQGTVWGTNDYTDDSGLCQAALHAGVIAPGGGTVTVVRGPGRPLYIGSSRNNVDSHDYGDYEKSITFRPTAARAP
jgi:hypothetical protein